MKWFFVIFLLLCVAFTAFIILTNKYVNPYKFYLWFGKKGSGKTTNLTKLAYKYSQKYNRHVYCTEPNIENTTYIHPSWIGHVWLEPESVLLIDEIGLIWHCRAFQSGKSGGKGFDDKVREWFKYQRHNHVIVHAYSQSFDIDKGLRDLVDGMYLVSNVLRVWSYGKKISKCIVLNKSTADSPSSIAENFEFESPLFFWETRSLTFIPHWVNKFVTDTRLNLPDYDTVNLANRRTD